MLYCKFKNIELKKELGEGAFGKIYLASMNGKPLCIKEVNKMKLIRQKGEIFFERERDNLLTIKNKHQNLLNLVDYLEKGEYCYIVTEFYNGGKVADYLDDKMENVDNLPFSEQQLQHVIKNILPSLNYLHSQHILHRDLKLDNLVIHYNTEADKQAKNILNSRIIIIDFGFSIKLKPGELAGENVGSSPYKDPNLLLKQIKNVELLWIISTTKNWIYGL